jgi:hypothetical protein
VLNALDKKHFPDYFAIDPFNIEKISHFIDKKGIDCNDILFATNDEYSLQLCNQLRQKYASPQSTIKNEDLITYLDKTVMKSRLLEKGIRVPKFAYLDKNKLKNENYLQSLINEIGTPFVLKPCAESNSRNISIIHDIKDFPQSILEDTIAYEVEEYIDGKIYICDKIHINGETKLLMINEYINPPLSFAKGVPHGSRTISADSDLGKKILAFSDQVTDAMPELDDAITHMEVFVKNGEPIFLEIASRAPGAYVARIGEIFRGINFEELNFRLQLKLPWKLAEKNLKHTGWVWFPRKDGVVIDIHHPKLSCEHEIQYNVGKNDVLSAIPQGTPNKPENAVCTCVWWDENEYVVKEIFEGFKKRSPVEINNPESFSDAKKSSNVL